MLNIQQTLILIVILVVFSMVFMASESFYGMSPGTLTQLSSTSVEPRKMYFLY